LVCGYDAASVIGLGDTSMLAFAGSFASSNSPTALYVMIVVSRLSAAVWNVNEPSASRDSSPGPWKFTNWAETSPDASSFANTPGASTLSAPPCGARYASGFAVGGTAARTMTSVAPVTSTTQKLPCGSSQAPPKPTNVPPGCVTVAFKLTFKVGPPV